MEQNCRPRSENVSGDAMTEQEWKAMLVEDKIAITNIVIGVVRKSGHMCLNRPLRYPIWLTPEADLYVKEKQK